MSRCGIPSRLWFAGDGGGKQEVAFYSGGFGPQMSGKFTGGKVRFFTEAPGPDSKPLVTVVAEGDLGAIGGADVPAVSASQGQDAGL